MRRKAANEWWGRIRQAEEETGSIPLPAIDRIHLHDDRSPTVVLVAPDLLPGATHVFVDLVHMSDADKITLYSLLGELDDEVRIKHHLTAVLHLGGLDYEFAGTEPDKRLTLEELPPARRVKAWGVLQAIARIGAGSPDRQASVVTEVPFP